MPSWVGREKREVSDTPVATWVGGDSGSSRATADREEASRAALEVPHRSRLGSRVARSSPGGRAGHTHLAHMGQSHSERPQGLQSPDGPRVYR